MNKKYISLFVFLVLIVVSFNVVCVASTEITLNIEKDLYELQTKENLGKYFSSKDTLWQGACIADKYIVICAINGSDNGNIYVFDKNGTDVDPKCKVEINGHHCNSITYDSKRSLLIVSARAKPPMLFELNKNTGEIVKKDFTFKQKEKLSDGKYTNPTTIAYNADEDNFVVLYSYASKYYIYSSEDFYNNNKSADVKKFSCKKYSSSYYCQQATVYNNCLFYTINKQDNMKLYTYIYVYDLLNNGAHIDTLTEKKSTLEVEGATFDPDNGYLYIFYRGHTGNKYKKFALYKTDISGNRYNKLVATFNGNGGTNGNSITQYPFKALGDLPTSTRDGYKFDGWYTEKTGGTKIDSTIKLSKNTTFYAHWIPIKYKIIYNLDGGSVENPETYDVETNNIILNKPNKTGYTFLGWTGSNGSIPQLSITIKKGSTGDKNYKANWKEGVEETPKEDNTENNTGTTTSGSNTGTTTSGSNTGTTTPESNTGTTTPENNTGTTTPGNNTGTTTPEDDNVSDEEEYTTEYKIKVIKATGGRIKPSTKMVEEGKNQTFKIIPDQGYIIDDVLVDGKSVGNVEKYVFRNVKETHTITAVFVEEINILLEAFDDVKDKNWYYDAVKYVVENKLFNGISEKEFGPNTKMTRGMLVTVLYRLSGSKATEKSTFDDVDQNSYYSSAIAWAFNTGIVNGVGNNNFVPDQAVSREDLATIMNRYIAKNKIKIKVENDSSEEYFDSEQISNYAFESVKQLKDYGLMTGKSKNYFEPKGLTTRAEVATILMRLASKKK